MMALFFAATGTPAITSLLVEVKIADTVSGINMVDNSSVHHLTITLSQVSNGLPMAITSLLAHSKCSDSVTRVVGHTLSINLSQVQY